MGTARRWEKTVDAVGKLLRTLTANDHVAIVTFSTSVSDASENGMLAAATPEWISELKDYMNANYATGGTVFEGGLSRAFEILEKTRTTEGAGAGDACENMILFMTDGNDSGFNMDSLGRIQSSNRNADPTIFTYEFGEGGYSHNLVTIAKHFDGCIFKSKALFFYMQNVESCFTKQM